MQGIPFVIVAVMIPLMALVFERAGNVRISERHHSRHDTYVVPVTFTRALTHAMLLMGFMGLVLGALCMTDVFSADPYAVMAFFDAFVVTTYVLWWHICRYKVSIFGDCMVVTPLVGPDIWVQYDQIERMEWTGFRKSSGYRDLDVIVDGRRMVRLHGIVDLEQILMRIDRFDALERPF